MDGAERVLDEGAAVVLAAGQLGQLDRELVPLGVVLAGLARR